MNPKSDNAPEHPPKGCSGRYCWVYAGVAAVILMVMVLILQPMHALQVTVVKQNLSVYLQRIVPGDRFSTGYVHSVELSPVQEYFYIDGDFRMILQETTFRSSNVGLPYAAFGDERFNMESDGFRITNMHRVVPQLLIWADRSYDNRLRFDDSNLALYGFAGNTLIRVGIQPLRWGDYVLQKAVIWIRHTAVLY